MKLEDLGCALESVVFKVIPGCSSLLKVKKRPVAVRQGQKLVMVVGGSRTFIQGGLMAFSMSWALSLALGSSHRMTLPGEPGVCSGAPSRGGSPPCRGDACAPLRSLPVVCKDVSP